MPLRPLLVLVVLAVLLGGCAEPRNKAAVDEIERRHIETMLIMGGAGGGGM